jgi:CheY-like chemotaxis protein
MSATPERLVLIVEHDVWLRWTLRVLFEQAGCDVICASNGVGGLRRAVELRPRLIVLGASLPELSTGELADELTAVHRFFKSQIVTVSDVFSGTLPDEDLTRAPVGSRGSSGRDSAEVVSGASNVHADRLEVVAELAKAGIR